MTKKFEQPVNATFVLPQSIHDLEIDEESTPEYISACCLTEEEIITCMYLYRQHQLIWDQALIRLGLAVDLEK